MDKLNIITTGSIISSDKVEGTNVYNANREKLGSVDDLMIDKYTGQVRYAVLEFGGFLGMGTDRYPMPWSMLKYDTALEGYVVPLSKEKIEKAPRYEQAKAPAYTDDYNKTVNTYWGAGL
jgi:sporulation protein YlmC with PRC-barrel domain